MNTAAEGAPNILFVLTDDQPSHTVYRMPKTLALFEDGVDLTESAYCAIPLCGPARASLFTGQYPHNHGVTGNETAWDRYRSKGYVQNDIFSRMRAAGYNVGIFGKWMNGFGTPEGDMWEHPACRREDGNRWVVLAGQTHKDPYMVNVNGRIHEERQNQTKLLTEYLLGWLGPKVNSSVPWFAYLPLTDPHGPYTPTLSSLHTADGARYTSPGTQEADISDKSAWTRSQGTATPAQQQEVYEGTLEELRDTDNAIERIFGFLAAAGQLDNTLVIFATDNGYMVGEHGGLTKKGKPYEEACHTPFLMRGPGVHTGAEGKLVGHLDITATVLDAASANTERLDGRSLMPLFANPAMAWRQRILTEHPFAGWSRLRDGDISYADVPGGEREMYDLAADPYELENLATDPAPENDARAEELSAHLAALKASSGDALRTAEGVYGG